MLTKYNLKMPREIFSGEDALENLKTILLANGVKKAAVFTDKGIQSAGLLDFPMDRIRAAGVESVILDDLPPEPTYSQVQALADAYTASGADFIIAVGGGSVMDTAKLSSILSTGEYTMQDLLDTPSLGRKHVKTLMIPTTAGTGAEATPNAIVAVPEKELKVGIVNGQMVADYVILDAVMIKKLPRKIAAATGVDALCHAIECWTSNKSNPFSDLFAMEALDLILNHIEPACDDSEAMDAKNKMQIASFLAGVAIAASGTTAVHALSYPLGGKYHIAHGVSNAILLVPVMKFNEPVCREKFAQAYDRCVHGAHTCETAEKKSAYMIQWMEEIVKHLEIPASLKEFGVPTEDLEDLVKSGMEVTRLLANNMREVTPDDARSIYWQIL
ncbi:Alcohol dehydrogenase [uncultured Flavonifractor sp.]|nr:Alcohol dehydrogenase [uncultured Flavonifractor sp.]